MTFLNRYPTSSIDNPDERRVLQKKEKSGFLNDRLRCRSGYFSGWVFALPVLLAGCSGMTSQFGCDQVATSQCTPVSRINAAAEAGAFDRFLANQTASGADKPASDKRQALTLQKHSQNNPHDQIHPNKSGIEKKAWPLSDSHSPQQRKRAALFRQFRWRGSDDFHHSPTGKSRLTIAGGPQRSPERIQRLWIAPYEDAAHHYHGASEVFVVLEPAHWMKPHDEGAGK